MCGILGIIGRRAHLEGALRTGVQALLHRGPDDGGLTTFSPDADTDAAVGLGVRRLAIQDLSTAGRQPMYDPRTGNWLAFNGEIYNFRDLRPHLERLGHTFSSTGDTEVLLKSYGQWGEDCLERLVGMFAFAVWDARRQCLFIARDRLGVKPLYYYESSNSFLFGSEIRALLATGLVPRRISRSGVSSYLAFGALQDPVTIIDGVSCLPPGCTLTWNAGNVRLRRYWSAAEIACRPPDTDSRDRAVRAIRERLLESVSQRLVSDVPVGIFLSGGVDSSAIVALTRELRSGPIDTFSIVFNGGGYCERRYSRSVAQVFSCRHHEITLLESQLREEIPKALAAMDQPSVDGVNTYVVSQASKRAGMTVALSGIGADELFAGYRTFVSVPRMTALRRHAPRLAPLRYAIQCAALIRRTDRLEKLAALVSGRYYGGHPYFLARALFDPSRVDALLPREWSGKEAMPTPRDAADIAKSIRTKDLINHTSVLEAGSYLVNTLLRDSDCMSMAHSLEVRSPFLDHRLWECVLPLPGRIKVDPRMSKPLLVGAAGAKLPQEIYLRRKMGFTLPFELWLRDGMGREVDRALSGTSSPLASLLQPAEVASVWRAFVDRKTSWSRPWSLYVLTQWVRRNIGDCIEVRD